jgi:large subunit ribosomal protein L15
MIKRIPKLRGRGKNSFKTIETKPVPVNLGLIEKHFANGDVVTPASLVEKRLAYRQNGKTPRVKILGTGDFSKKVTFSGCEFSLPAKERVLKAGGSVI